MRDIFEFTGGKARSEKVSDTTWKKHMLFKEYIKVMSRDWFKDNNEPFYIIDMHAGGGIYEDGDMAMGTWLLNYIQQHFPTQEVHATLCEIDDDSRKQLTLNTLHIPNIRIVKDHYEIDYYDRNKTGLIICDPNGVTEWVSFYNIIYNLPNMHTFHHLMFVHEHRHWKEDTYIPLLRRIRGMGKKYMYVSEKFRDKVIITTSPTPSRKLAMTDMFWSTDRHRYGYKEILRKLECRHCVHVLGNKMSKEWFIRSSELTHGKGIYDYSEIIWNGAKEKVQNVRCIKHNRYFNVQPMNHIHGAKCAKCEREDRTNVAFKRNTDIANKKFDNKFTYIRESVEHLNEKMTIICPDHKEFKMLLRDHVKSIHGCPKCAIEARAKGKILTRKEFNKKVKKKFGNSVSVKNITEYNGYCGPLTYMCPEHGEQKFAVAHVALRGYALCGKCGNSMGKTNAITFDTFISRLNDKFNGVLTSNEEDWTGWQSPTTCICTKCGKIHTLAVARNVFIRKKACSCQK